MRLAPALTALLLAGCAAPPVFTWTDTIGGEVAEYYTWEVRGLDDFRKLCSADPRTGNVLTDSVVYNSGACAFQPTHRYNIVTAPARDINTHAPVEGFLVGALCVIYSTLSFPAAQFARSGYLGEWRTVLDHELEHCKGKSHPVYTPDQVRGVR